MTEIDLDGSDAPDAGLRADIRLVTSFLGETLVRAEGQQLLDLVESVREHAKKGSLADLPDLDFETVTTVARAFTAYFHLANVTEQVHRGRTLRREHADEGGWIAQALARIVEAGTEVEDLAAVAAQITVRPVFTAHPTEVTRRSTLEKLRRIAALLEEPEGAVRTRRLRESIDLLWQTDEIRVEAPEPLDEARNGVYYLEGLSSAAVPDVLEELRDQLAERGIELPLAARPLRFGTWIGGDRDGNPNVTPAITRDALELQAVHGIRMLRTLVDRLRRDLSVSERLSAADPEITSRLDELLPGLPRSRRATAGSTPRSRTGSSSPA